MRLSFVVVAVSGFAVQLAPARATTYTFTKLNPIGGATEFQAAGLNNNGVVASKTGGSVFTFDGSNYTYFSNLGGVSSSSVQDVGSIDDSGIVAFDYSTG